MDDDEDLEEHGGVVAIELTSGEKDGRQDAVDEEEKLHEFVEDVTYAGVEGSLLANSPFGFF